jgi:hypothetical protein
VLAASLFTLMAATGIGTGSGSLGPRFGHVATITRGVGAEVTIGNVTLLNEGWLPITIERIRPIPAEHAQDGVEIVAVEVADLSPADTDAFIGMVDGSGYDAVRLDLRRSPRGQVLPPQWRAGEGQGMVQTLVRIRVLREGEWTYRGYEVTYRSGLVRHRAVLPVDITACTPGSVPRDSCGG